jgi:putative SOS response-associated peptidase YedK
MCGRITLIIDPERLRAELDLGVVPAEYQSRYNIAPTQPVMVVNDALTRSVVWMRWGLIPSWAKDPSIGSRLINARAETLVEKPSFRTAFQRRRCLILADGFYEWQRHEGKSSPSTPYYFHLENNRPFAFAGLWDTWMPPDGSELDTCTIITTIANGVVAPIHDRMPVMLYGENLWKWLAPNPLPVLQAMLVGCAENELSCHPVGRWVNDPRREDPILIKPVG